MTRYVVNPASLGNAGRTVRCARCGHQWHQKPEVPVAPVAQAQTSEKKSKSSRFDGGPPPEVMAAASTAAPSPPRRANLPAVRKRRFSFAGIALPPNVSRWAAFAAAVAVLIGGLLVGQSSIVAAWPPAVRLYDIVGLGGPAEEAPGAGLEMPALSPRIEMDAGTPVLVLEGTVINKSNHPITLPALMANLRDDRNVVVESWTFRTDVERLAPGATASFRTRKERPPERARHVDVVFTNAAPK